MPVSFFPADEKLRAAAKSICEKVNPEINVHEGRVATGDQFIADKAKKEFIVTNFQAKCTEMEGAAIAQAAYNNSLPFLIIRAISDKADNSAQMDYPTFEKQAIEHTVKLMLALVEEVA
jgi:adenosylhomocysteine nucleosidase